MKHLYWVLVKFSKIPVVFVQIIDCVSDTQIDRNNACRYRIYRVTFLSNHHSKINCFLLRLKKCRCTIDLVISVVNIVLASEDIFIKIYLWLCWESQFHHFLAIWESVYLTCEHTASLASYLYFLCVVHMSGSLRLFHTRLFVLVDRAIFNFINPLIKLSVFDA